VPCVDTTPGMALGKGFLLWRALGRCQSLPSGRVAVGEVKRANGQLCRLFLPLFIALILPIRRKLVARSTFNFVNNCIFEIAREHAAQEKYCMVEDFTICAADGEIFHGTDEIRPAGNHYDSDYVSRLPTLSAPQGWWRGGSPS